MRIYIYTITENGSLSGMKAYDNKKDCYDLAWESLKRKWFSMPEGYAINVSDRHDFNMNMECQVPVTISEIGTNNEIVYEIWKKEIDIHEEEDDD